ncbi:MAG: FKBP-type peptidyl-prolyl cis-trans isomerase [Bacteroidales bacterium]|nr:FKBP-type peptidyl-prolyl cis-trans isomerase [Bacteroidales bacterium]
MKRIVFLILIGVMMIAESSAQRGKRNRLENKTDSVSYAIGVSFANSMKNLNIPELNLEKIYMAIGEVINNEEAKLTVSESQKIIQAYMTELKEYQIKENLIRANEFLEKNKKREGVIVLPNGLQYEVLLEGSGESPVSTSKVKTHYKGTLLDGSVFDSSYDRGEPIDFQLGRVIKGWQEALKLMKPGAKWKLYIHPDLGYGERDTEDIPANSLLIFDIELLSVE